MESSCNVRMSNFELLRIFSMLMILSSHAACHGVQWCLSETMAYQEYIRGTTVNKMFTCFLNPGGEIGVALFFMITGYFYIKKKEFSLIKIVLECAFYGLFSIILFFLIKLFDSRMMFEYDRVLPFLMKCFFIPVTGGGWWFVTAYFFLMLLGPLINNLLSKLNRNGWILVLVFSWIVWYAVAYVSGSESYSVQRAVTFYALGAYFRIHTKPLEGRTKKIIYMLAFWLVWSIGAFLFFRIADYSIVKNMPIQVKLLEKLIHTVKTVIIVPLCAVLMFKLFEAINVKKNKYVNAIAKTTFGVYLIHDSLIAREYIWHNLLKIDTVLYRQKLFPLYALVSILVVYVICMFIDFIRMKVFEPIMVKRFNKLMKYVKYTFMNKEYDVEK